jgi:hypothetical protein
MKGFPRQRFLRGWSRLTASGVLLLSAAAPGAALGSQKALLKIETEPPGALVSVRQSAQATAGELRQVAGTTPLEKVFDFGKGGRLWLELEKRGYAPKSVEATPDTKTVNVPLERIKTQDGSEAGGYVFPPLRKMLMAGPEIRVTLRHFAKEEVSTAQGSRLGNTLGEAVRASLSGHLEVEVLPPTQGGEDELTQKALWRDTRTSMELLDPIRLPYLPEAPCLETRSGRDAARRLGERVGADAVLAISGRQTVETGGMKVGKVALFAAGTAASYGAAYSTAMVRADSFFVYPVYVPAFAQGLLLQAALVRCGDGEVLWINKGVWSPLSPDDPAEVARVVKELLSGLP